MEVRAAPALDQEFAARYSRQTGLRSIGVTDLISLRRAFFRWQAPAVPIPESRQARIEQGRAVHRDVGALLSREGILEARVRRDGLVGRIDILAEVPVEVKTASTVVEPSALLASRPDHVEQLAMYCALVDRPAGRLLTLVLDQGTLAAVQALEVTFADPGRVLAEMKRRAELLRTASTDGSAAGLPRCPWFGRGCEFEEARVCGCRGDEPENSNTVLASTQAVREQPAVEERVRALVDGARPPPAAAALLRFRDVVYPRRTFFERTSPAVEAPSPPAEPTPLPTMVADLYARLAEALESGPAGEVARVPPRSPDPDEEVVGFRGRPVLVRTSRAWDRYLPDQLLERSPQYALELGLRCAATGTDSGHVVVGFERAEQARDRIQVLEVRFRSVTPFSRLLRDGSRRLTEAIRRTSPGDLAPCPGWMFEDCPYRSGCGCAGSANRSNR